VLFVPVVVTSVVGGAIFYLLQRTLGAGNSFEQLGRAVVRQGGYPVDLAPLVGMGVHLSVAFAYTALYAIVAWMMFGALGRRLRWLAAGLLAGLLALAATLVAPLASRTVVSLLAGNGLPASLPALQMEVGQPLWTHVIFFGIAWLGTVVALDIE
jgi:hypothetical protein